MNRAQLIWSTQKGPRESRAGFATVSGIILEQNRPDKVGECLEASRSNPRMCQQTVDFVAQQVTDLTCWDREFLNMELARLENTHGTGYSAITTALWILRGEIKT